MLWTLEGPGGSQLQCGSHVDFLLGKMPHTYPVYFMRHCMKDGILVGTNRIANRVGGRVD